MAIKIDKLRIVNSNDNNNTDWNAEQKEQDTPAEIFASNERINSSLIDEYMRHHRFKVGNLRGYQSELWQAATNAVLDNWYFPVNGCPWEPDYFTQKYYLDARGKRHHEKEIESVSPPTTRMNRSRWLYICAEEASVVREIEWQFDTATTWGVINAELLRGTYETMKTHNPNTLVTHKQIMGSNDDEGDLCIINQNTASRTKIRELLNKHVFDPETNRHATIAGMDNKKIAAPISFDNPRQKPYYVRVNGRLSFSIKMIIKAGTYIAGGIYVNKDGWDRHLSYWENTLKIDREVIDVCLAKLNGAGKNKTWHWT